MAALNTGLQTLPPTISIFGNNLYQNGLSVLPALLESHRPVDVVGFSTPPPPPPADGGKREEERRVQTPPW